MVKTLPDNELVRMRNPLFQYSFATTDLKEEEWKASDIDVRTGSTIEKNYSHEYRSPFLVSKGRLYVMPVMNPLP